MELTSQQQSDFDAINERMGFGKTERSDFSKAKSNEPIVLSADPSESTVPPKYIKVSKIEDLKSLFGWSPKVDTATLKTRVQEALPEIKDIGKLAKIDRHKIKVAATSYLLGYPHALGAEDLSAINSAMFPMTLATFSYDDVKVTKDSPLILKDGVWNNFGVVTVEPGGQIIGNGSANMNCQQLKQVGEQPSGSYTITVELPPITPVTAKNGGNGKTPTDKGVPGVDGTSCGSRCRYNPSNGGQGPGGQNGENGDNGLNGANGPILVCDLGEIDGKITIKAGSQKGQNGGKGGDGGNGGPGGPPGSCPGPCTCAKTGPQGHGGDGGRGGDAGDGGNGAQIHFSYTGNGIIYPTKIKSEPGEPGEGGTPGTGQNKDYSTGNGISKGDGNPGIPGDDPVIVES